MALDIKSFNHVSRQCADVDVSIQFYCDVLGFRPLSRPGFKFQGAWLYHESSDIQMHLIGDQEIDPGDPEINSRANHIAFHADSTEAVKKVLESKGISFKENVQQGSGTIQIFFHDPDGHTVEIATYPPKPAFID